MKKIAIYPGTFDPVTNGHIDLIQRSLNIFDEIIIAVAPSEGKKPLFDLDERMDLIKESVGQFDGAKVASFNSLLIDYAKSMDSVAIIRGLRAVSDFEYELQMALMNRRLASEIETVFMMPNQEHIFLSSTIVKEVAKFGGDVSRLVPETVEKALKEKLK